MLGQLGLLRSILALVHLFCIVQIAPGENDTVRVIEQLEQQKDATGILSTLSKIHGPWSFMYWQVRTLFT